jgi:hypothetical protein
VVAAAPSCQAVAWVAALSQAAEDWQQTLLLQVELLLLPQLVVFAFGVFEGVGFVVVFWAPVPGQGVGLLTRLVSSQGSGLERAYGLDWERHGRGTDYPSGAEVRLAGESCVGETVLVKGHPTAHLVAVAAASVPCSVVGAESSLAVAVVPEK